MANKGCKFPAEVLTKTEIHDLLKTFPKTKIGLRNRALVTVYLFSQLRCNEALELRQCDIDFERGAITVLNGKGGKRRVVGIHKEKLTAVLEWIAVRPVSRYLFCNLKGGRMDDSYVRRMLKRIAQRAGISRRAHVHGLRHTGATLLANKGVDLRVLRDQLGHTSLAITDRYISHLCPSHVITAINATVLE